jgi:hypothetical protein
MSRWNPTDAELLAFLDEALPAAQMAELETRCRDDDDLRQRLAVVRGREDAGLHTIGAIWRRHRLSCPDRETLGQFLLGVLEGEAAEYLRFHLEEVGCRYCQANVADMQARQAEAVKVGQHRRTRYLQTSAGYLPKREEEAPE